MSYNQTIKYVQKYQPTVPITKDFVFQETQRIDDANNFNSQSPSGWTSLDKIASTYTEADISQEFKDFIREELKKVDKTKDANVRRQVKNIWMYPRTDYLPWCQFNESNKKDLLDKANQILAQITPKLKVVEGKLYLMLETFNTQFVKHTTDLIKELEVEGLRENMETEHVTVVNSDVLCKLDRDQVNKFIEKFIDIPFIMEANDIKHTVSFDWARFSVCVVVTLHSKELDSFVSEFNKVFGTNVKIYTHITSVILPRS
jgi:hypothetical protein